MIIINLDPGSKNVLENNFIVKYFYDVQLIILHQFREKHGMVEILGRNTPSQRITKIL